MVNSRLARTAALLAATSLSLSACATPVAGPSGNYARSIGTAPVTVNPTPYSDALVCMAGYARSTRLVAPRIAVGRARITISNTLSGGWAIWKSN